MKEEVVIKKERDGSLEHVKILKAIWELPFPVGKNLLADFLIGDYSNDSIGNNNLDELNSFGTINSNKEVILREIDELIQKGMVIVSGSNINRFWKVLSLTPKGREEIHNPTLKPKEMDNRFDYKIVDITPEDRVLFKELESFLQNYNDEQKKGIIHDKEKILCVAGAGSGKTTVLTKRIEFMIRYKGVDPQKILAITFTRKAKEEMGARLADLGILTHVETFNSFCEGILRKYSRMIYGRQTRIMGYQDKMLALSLALSKIGMNIESAMDIYFSDSQKKNKTREQLVNTFMNDCFFILDYFKTKNQDIYDFSVDSEKKDFENAKMVYRICVELKQHMEVQGLRDYTDQVIDVIEFFKKNRNFIPEFEHILVDEYQDVNAMQIELIELLNSRNLFCVGDPRQSIFGWRGSDISYILNFEKSYPGSDIIVLNKNYRSSRKIVEFMNRSIKEMGLVNIESCVDKDNEIKILNFDDELEEFNFVADKILGSRVKRSEIFVLSRTNKQLNELSKIFKLRGIPHVVKSDEIHRPVTPGENDVTLATIHSIKGLEAEMVFLIGCSESNFPSKASDHPIIEMIKIEEYDKEDEEKRLFYVAISRAKEKLYISYSGKKKTYFIDGEMENLADD